MRGAISTIAHRWIKDAEDVKYFLRDCIIKLDLGMGFHCDTPFEEYIFKASDIPCFTNKEAKALNKKLEDCFNLCRRKDLDIYELGLEVMQPILDKAFGKDVQEFVDNNGSVTQLPVGQGTYGPYVGPNLRITTDDEKMIDMYKLVLDSRTNPNLTNEQVDSVTAFLKQRYHRVLRELELALCAELKTRYPYIYNAVERMYVNSKPPVKGNEL